MCVTKYQYENISILERKGEGVKLLIKDINCSLGFSVLTDVSDICTKNDINQKYFGFKALIRYYDYRIM